MKDYMYIADQERPQIYHTNAGILQRREWRGGGSLRLPTGALSLHPTKGLRGLWIPTCSEPSPPPPPHPPGPDPHCDEQSQKTVSINHKSDEKGEPKQRTRTDVRPLISLSPERRAQPAHELAGAETIYTSTNDRSFTKLMPQRAALSLVVLLGCSLL